MSSFRKWMSEAERIKTQQEAKERGRRWWRRLLVLTHHYTLFWLVESNWKATGFRSQENISIGERSVQTREAYDLKPADSSPFQSYMSIQHVQRKIGLSIKIRPIHYSMTIQHQIDPLLEAPSTKRKKWTRIRFLVRHLTEFVQKKTDILRSGWP